MKATQHEPYDDINKNLDDMALDLGLGDDENLDFLNKVSEHFIPKKSIPSLIIENPMTSRNKNRNSINKIQNGSFTNPSQTPKSRILKNQASNLLSSPELEVEVDQSEYKNRNSIY